MRIYIYMNMNLKSWGRGGGGVHIHITCAGWGAHPVLATKYIQHGGYTVPSGSWVSCM